MCVEMSQQHRWLAEMNCREGLLELEKKDFYWKECGFEGEVRFAKLAEKASEPGWQWLFDLRLQTKAGEIQLDAVLICEAGWFCFEVKNYRANYQFSDNRMVVNGVPKYHDAFRQVERSRSIFDKIAGGFSGVGAVKYYVVFINEADSVEVSEGVSDIPYIKNAKLQGFFQDLRYKCQKVSHLREVLRRDFDEEARQLRAMHEGDSRRYSLTEERFVSLRKGLYCEQCSSFDVEVTRYYVVCRGCGFCEGKEKASLRLVCALGTLLPYERLRPYKVWQLGGGMLGLKSIRIVMSKNCTQNGMESSFKNTNQSFNKQFGHLDFRYKDKYLLSKINQRKLP